MTRDVFQVGSFTLDLREVPLEEQHDRWIDAGEQLMHDPLLQQGMQYDGRPITLVEMHAYCAAANWGATAIAEQFIRSLNEFCHSQEQGVSDDGHGASGTTPEGIDQHREGDEGEGGGNFEGATCGNQV